MIKCLRDPIIKDKKEYNSAWQYMCYKITQLAKERNIDVDYTNLPMPDYTKL